MNKGHARLLIAGTGSGCGKTTVVCALLQALKTRGLDTAAFKCGPDYIDPMFHTEIIGTPSTNIDLFFSSETSARATFTRHAARYNVIEGVMGYYDGMAMDSPKASAHDVARVLSAPAVLIVNARGMALSAAAVVKGYDSLRTLSGIKGVILNGISAMIYPSVKKAVETETGIRVYGFMPDMPDCALESRHLGLITAGEIDDLHAKLERMAAQAEKSLDIDGLLALMDETEALYAGSEPVEALGYVRVAVARDKAFCFYYRDNLELLEALGAELVPFSPLTDESLPDCDGVYLGGGYPELYLERLSANVSMRESIRAAIENGLPTIAECGGFMYLTNAVAGHRMVGAIDTECFDTGRLCRFGYITVHAETDSLLFAAGDSIRAHEFHYWDADAPGDALRAEKPSGRGWRCARVTDTLYAGYPHLYMPSAPETARRFIGKCLERKNAI